MAKSITEVLYEITEDWGIAREMRSSIPSEFLKKLVEEWNDTKERLEYNSYSENPFMIRDERNSDRGKKLQALTVKTLYRRSAPRDRDYSFKVFVGHVWAAKGVTIGERNLTEEYVSKDCHGVDYEYDVRRSFNPPSLKLKHRRHGWAIIELKDVTDGDDYDWPERCHEYIVALV